MIWRVFLLLLWANAFSGCSSDDGPGENLLDLFSRQTQTPAASEKFRQLAQANTPAVLVSIKDRNQTAAFLRQTRRNGVEHWVGANNVSLDFKSGFLVASRGLGGDLMSVDIAQSTALVLAAKEGLAKRFHSYLDGEDQIVIRSYVCEIKSRGNRKVDLGKRMVNTQLMQERCNNGEQSFQNLYWVAKSQRVIVQSRQWASGSIGGIALRTILR